MYGSYSGFSYEALEVKGPLNDAALLPMLLYHDGVESSSLSAETASTSLRSFGAP